MHGQSDFFNQYIDSYSHAVLSYYCDFIFLRDASNGSLKYVIVEVMAENQIDDRTVLAKAEFAGQLPFQSGFDYRIIKSSHADAIKFLSYFDSFKVEVSLKKTNKYKYLLCFECVTE